MTPFGRTYALEAMLGCLMVTCGLALMWPGDTFILPHYVFVRHFVPEIVGGAFLAVIGLLRLRAIILNGGYRYSPILRIGGCCIGGGWWFSLAVAITFEVILDPNRPMGLGLPLLMPVAYTAFLFEILAAMKGSEDANHQDSFRIRESRSRYGQGA